jgi:hypothetical protein
MLAEGIVRAYKQRVRGLEDRLMVVGERFAEDSVSLDQPYRRQGSPEVSP